MVYAEVTYEGNNNSLMCGDSGTKEKISIDEQLERIVSDEDISSEVKLKAVAKIEKIKKIKEQANKKKTYNNTGEKAIRYTAYNCPDTGDDLDPTNWKRIILNVPYYKQENNYYCGSATTKQTLQFLKGSSPSQSQMAKAIGTTASGTDGHVMLNYINKNQNKTQYIYGTPGNMEDFSVCIDLDLKDGIPIILRIKMSKSQGWRYNSNGHFMNVSGRMVTNLGEMQVTDPYIQWVDSSCTTGKYDVDPVVIFDSILNHPMQEFYI